MKRLFFASVTFLACSAAMASIPQGRDVGPWHVTWITSLSGADADASVVLWQEHNLNRSGVGDSFEARWDQERGSVNLSLRIQNCRGENKDFYKSLPGITTEKWVEFSDDRAAEILLDTLKIWAMEAQEVCTTRHIRGIFKTQRLQEATQIFDEMVKYFAPPVKGSSSAQTH